MLNSNAHHTVNARILTTPEPEVQQLADRSVAALHNTDRHDCTQQRQDGAAGEHPHPEPAFLLAGGLVCRLLLGVRPGADL